ncbi:MAG: hypothetical protein JNJ77_09890 [Planctomycetia bacterium]|nr:hypothetical protein [Planctomycetia bacterium]
MNPALKNDAELYFESGGPTYRFTHQLVQHWHIGKSIRPRILAFLVITWVPLLMFALLEGRALGSDPRHSLLLDFGTFTRFFLAIPLLIVAEIVIGPRLRSAGLQFIQGGYVRPEDYPAFDQAIANVVRWRESKWAEAVIIGLAVLGAWFLTAETFHGSDIASWRSVNRHDSLFFGKSLTGLWYHIVAIPIIQFFLYRWLWRLIIWTRFLWTVSRMNLNLVATHADQAGGLGFLGSAHNAFGILAFALSCVLSAEVASLIVFHDAQIESFKMEFVVVLILVQTVFFGPLLVFVPLLSRTRLAWLRKYSLFVAQYNRAFHDKWIDGKPPADEKLLGTADIQSLADLGSSFEYIRNMKVVPFSMRVMIQLAIMTSIPCLPLLLLVFPLNKLLGLLAGAVF